MVVEVTMVAVSTPMAATGEIGEIGEIEEIGVVDREIKLSVVTAASLQHLICHGSSMMALMVDTTTVW